MSAAPSLYYIVHMKRRISVLLLIRSMHRGGAERQIVELLSALDQTRFDVGLVTFYDGGELRPAIERIGGIKLYAMSDRPRRDFRWVPRLANLARKLKPDIVLGYLSTGNWGSVLAAKLAGSKTVWAIRGSNNRELGHYTPVAHASFHLARMLSRFADLVIFNSHAGRDYYLEQGYAPARSMVIPNGIDTGYFKPRPQAGLDSRAQWGIPSDAPLIGMVARLDPVKDHPTFLRAASRLLRDFPAVRFVCVGSGPPAYTAHLKRLAGDLGLDGRVGWTGELEDMPAVYSALDIASLCTPFGEGFPNTVGEAMACGAPCVVTPAGDSALIVDDTGMVVKAGNPEELAAGWKRMLALSESERARSRDCARMRIWNRYRKELMVERTERALLLALCVGAPSLEFDYESPSAT